MRERINRLAKGIIDMETPALTIWPERMEEEIPADEVTRKDFFVTSGNGLHPLGAFVTALPMRLMEIN